MPSTAAGIKAVFGLGSESIGVHVTDVAADVVYRRVAEASIAGLRHRAERGLPVTGIASPATLSASECDRAADVYGEVFSDAALSDLGRLGARRQTILRLAMFERRSRSRRAAVLRSFDGLAGGGPRGAGASSAREEA